MALTLSSITSKLKNESSDQLNEADRAYINEFHRITNDYSLNNNNNQNNYNQNNVINDKRYLNPYNQHFYRQKEQILRQQQIINEENKYNCMWSLIVIIIIAIIMTIAVFIFPSTSSTNIGVDHYLLYFAILISTIASFLIVILVASFLFRQWKRWRHQINNNQNDNNDNHEAAAAAAMTS